MGKSSIEVTCSIIEAKQSIFYQIRCGPVGERTRTMCKDIVQKYIAGFMNKKSSFKFRPEPNW